MKKTEKEYRKFEAEVIAMPPLRLVLSDIPEPDPKVKAFRSKQMMARKIFLQNSDTLQRLIEHMAIKE